MGQIVGGAAKPKRCNLNKLSQLGTPAAGVYILVSSDNSMNAAGQGNFDRYIVGDGTTAAAALELKSVKRERTLAKISYIGLGTGLVYATSNVIENVIPTHKYRIYIEDKNALSELTGTSAKIRFYCGKIGSSDTTLLQQISVANPVLNDYYDFVIPDGYNTLFITGRAATGYEFKAFVSDITSYDLLPFENGFVCGGTIYEKLLNGSDGLFQCNVSIGRNVNFSEALEKGSISINANGYTYSNSSTRVRTKQNFQLYLKKGDTINVGQGKRIYIGCTDDNGAWYYSGWYQTKYEAQYSGKYVFVISDVSESTISDFDNYVSGIYIYMNDSIENRISAIENTTNTPFTIEEKINSDGSFTSDHSYLRTDYIPVLPNVRYKFKIPNVGVSTVRKAAFFYSSDGTTFSLVSVSDNVSLSFDVTIPQNANYVVLGGAKINYSLHRGYGVEMASNFVREFPSLELVSSTKDLWTNSAIINNTDSAHQEHSNNNYLSNIYYYNVSAYSKIGFLLSDNSYTLGMSFYDENFDYITGVSESNHVVPDGAVYMKFQINKTGITVSNISVGLIELDWDNISLKSSQSSSEHDLKRSFGNEEENVENYLEELYENFVELNTDELFTFDGIAVRKNGVEGEATTYISTDYIFIKSGAKIEYYNYIANGNWCSLAVFDKDKVYKSELSRFQNISMEKQEFTASEDVYIRLACDKAPSHFSKAYLKYKGINDTVPNRLAKLEQSEYNYALPSYWLEYLDSRKGDLNSLVSLAGNHGDLFVFFTDFHYVRNTLYSPNIIKYLYEHFGGMKVFNGGDVLNTHTFAEAMKLEQDFSKLFNGIDIYNAIGNHDSNPYGGTGNTMTIDNYYPLLLKNLEKNPFVTATTNGYYYVDNRVQKIRYIVLNTGENGLYPSTASGIEQLDWFVSTLNSVESNWYVVVITHMFYECYKNSSTDVYYIDKQCGTVIKAITDAYQNKTSGTVGSYSFDFTSAHGLMAGILTGHVHYDYSEQSEAGYPIVANLQDGIGYPSILPNNPTRNYGDVTEHAIDIVAIDKNSKTLKMLRLGSGSDRTFTFT